MRRTVVTAVAISFALFANAALVDNSPAMNAGARPFNYEARFFKAVLRATNDTSNGTSAAVAGTSNGTSSTGNGTLTGTTSGGSNGTLGNTTTTGTSSSTNGTTGITTNTTTGSNSGTNGSTNTTSSTFTGTNGTSAAPPTVSSTLPKTSSTSSTAPSTTVATKTVATTTTTKTYTNSTTTTTNSTTISMASTTSKDGSCFPAAAMVEKEDGSVVRMDELEIGDRVRVAPNKFSDIFMFTHKTTSTRAQFLAIQTLTGQSLVLTHGHYLYINGQLKAARAVKVNNVVTLWNGEQSAVVRVTPVLMDGLFNPQTMDGRIVVNGIMSSTYTEVVHPAVAHAILAPVRVLYTWGLSPFARSFHNSNYGLAQFCPIGASAY